MAEKHKYKGCCGLCSRTFRMGGLRPPNEVQELFDKYAVNGVVGAAQLQQFLVEVQGMKSVTLKDAEDIIGAELKDSRFLPALHRHEFNLNTFLQFLLNPNLNPAINTEIHHDMSRPMSHYFIFTSHNSYLTGNQLSSKGSEEPIIKALRRGARVVELDLWPNSDEDNIEVLHGKTLTSPVDFAKCVRAIKENAFVASEYPVVITLEDHLNPALQAKVAEILTETLGEVLHIPAENEMFKEFPSPEDLRKRILISTKPPKEYLAAPLKEDSPPQPTKGGAWGEDVPSFQKQMDQNSDKQGPPVAPPANDDGDDDDDDDDDEEEAKKPAPEYKRIIAIRQKKKPKDVSMKDVLAEEESVVKRISLSEAQLEKICKNHGRVVIKFTSRNIMRIYPYGLRIDSSNYNPFVGWAHGAQMVALNMQGYGRPLWLVHGFFKANGGCGYVKKPDYLLPGGSLEPPTSSLPVKTTLKVKVHMGTGWLEKFGKRHFDNWSPPDFYVKVAIVGVPADQRSRRTQAVEDDWHPIWESEFEFPLTVPELAVLRLEVHEYDMSDKDDFGGQLCLPVSELKTGFRCVTLCDKLGDELTGVKLLLSFHFV